MAAGSLVSAFATEPTWTRETATMAFIAVGLGSLVVSTIRKSAGVAGQRGMVDRRSQRVAAMTGIDRDEQRFDRDAAEFPPVLDLITAGVGLVAVLFGGIAAGDPVLLSVTRAMVGALFLGVVSDAMLLGHWYLVQPGLARGPILEPAR